MNANKTQPDVTGSVSKNLPSFGEAFRFWLKMGFISFGGPAGQIAILHAELVEKKKWISEERFLHALNYCMLLPGPEAQQLCIYLGWLMHRTIGGVVAGALFVLPAYFLLTTLSWIYVKFGQVQVVEGIFYGFKAAVLAIVVAAIIRIGKKALKNWVMVAIAAAAFAGLFLFKVPFPIIVLSAGVIGFVGNKLWPALFKPSEGHGKASGGDTHVVHDDHFKAPHTIPSWSRLFKVLTICLLLWIVPLLVIFSTFGKAHSFFREAVFFSKAAMVTFGGAYAVLPYIAEAGVQKYHWLAANQMIDGLALAETTPGPLIMVVTFVGFLGGWNNPGMLSPELAAIGGSFIATYFTFLPCFLWIFLGAPYIEQTRGNLPLMSILSGITAAVVGIILNLAVFFGSHALFTSAGRMDWILALLAFVSFIGLWRWKWDVLWVLFGCAVIGCLVTSL